MKKLLMMALLLLFLSGQNSAGSPGCPIGCKCNDRALVVQCENSRLDVIPITLNPAIQRLILRNNNIKTVDAALQFYMDLQYIDISSNHLVNIPSKSFLHQENLQELHLSQNKLSSVNNKTFQGLKSLTVLNLRENFLGELLSGTFSTLPKLEELNLSKNRISKIDPLAFDSLLSLRVLYLDDNLMTSIPTPSFYNMGSLAELHLGLNAFNSLPVEAFKGLNRLSVLDLGSGGIINISEQAFKGLTSLRNLNLVDNQLQQIPTGPLSYLSRIEELIIGQNQFNSLRKGSFRGLKNLRKLDITEANNLKYIEPGAFVDNMNLEAIVLVGNKKLEQLEEGVLQELPNLRSLVLRDNSFTSFRESLLSWNNLYELKLSDNPLNCDCQILWLLKLVNQKNLTDVQCASPEQMRGGFLKSFSSDDLGCSFSDQKLHIIIVTFCVTATVLLAAIGLFLFRYRSKVRVALKDYKLDKSGMNRREHEYQNSFFEDEYSLQSSQLPIKHIPVSDLYEEIISTPSEDCCMKYGKQDSRGSMFPRNTLPVTGFTYVRTGDTCRVHSLRTLKVDVSSVRNQYEQCPLSLLR